MLKSKDVALKPTIMENQEIDKKVDFEVSVQQSMKKRLYLMKMLIRKNKKKLKNNHICWQDTVKEEKLENR